MIAEEEQMSPGRPQDALEEGLVVLSECTDLAVAEQKA